MKIFKVLSFANADALAKAATRDWLDEVVAANKEGVIYTVALSGGRIADNLYAAMVKQTRAKKVSLKKVHFFWADERCVPPDDAESNFKTANDFLFQPLKIAASQVHRIRGEDAMTVAAKKASAEIVRVAATTMKGQPVLDLIILGIGPDGHTASLFPRESAAMRANQAIYRTIRNSPKPPPNRVTMGYPVIAAAKERVGFGIRRGKRKGFCEIVEAGRKNAVRDGFKVAEIHENIF